MASPRQLRRQLAAKTAWDGKGTDLRLSEDLQMSGNCHSFQFVALFVPHLFPFCFLYFSLFLYVLVLLMTHAVATPFVKLTLHIFGLQNPCNKSGSRTTTKESNQTSRSNPCTNFASLMILIFSTFRSFWDSFVSHRRRQ